MRPYYIDFPLILV